jgi:hypothetical protein
VPRRNAILLLGAFVVALVLAGLAGSATAPGGGLFEFRRSTYLTGRHGAKALADVLERLGIAVERRQESFFRASVEQPGDQTLALLDVAELPAEAEAQRLADIVRAGGRLFLAGSNGVEQCFGVERVWLDEPEAVVGPDSVALPDTEALLDSLTADEEENAPFGEPPSPTCIGPRAARIDTLLTTHDGHPVAWHMRFAAGGTVTMVAESRYVTNELLRETNIGPVVVDWLLEPGTRRVVFDEYHQGYARRQSIVVAAVRWATASPAGWAMLQLALVGLIALLAAAIRFGPARHVVVRRRRSSVEHVDALATGLERAGGSDAAVALIAGGLRRRLLRTGTPAPSNARDQAAWLAALRLSARTPEARRAVASLGALVGEHGGNEHVLAAATAVEDVWEALRPSSTSDRS